MCFQFEIKRNTVENCPFDIGRCVDTETWNIINRDKNCVDILHLVIITSNISQFVRHIVETNNIKIEFILYFDRPSLSLCVWMCVFLMLAFLFVISFHHFAIREIIFHSKYFHGMNTQPQRTMNTKLLYAYINSDIVNCVLKTATDRSIGAEIENEKKLVWRIVCCPCSYNEHTQKM